MKIMAKQCEGLGQSPAASAGTICTLLEYAQAILSLSLAVSPVIARDALHTFLFDVTSLTARRATSTYYEV
jgi:hypothetical protein